MRGIVRKERPHPGAPLRFTDLGWHRFTCFATSTRRSWLLRLLACYTPDAIPYRLLLQPRAGIAEQLPSAGPVVASLREDPLPYMTPSRPCVATR
jgi:hypothetical protein